MSAGRLSNSVLVFGFATLLFTANRSVSNCKDLLGGQHEVAEMTGQFGRGEYIDS